MKLFSFFAIALCAAMFVSCNNNGGQQPAAQATPSNAGVAQQAPAQQAPAQGAPQAQAAPQAGVTAAVTDFINKNFPGTTITGQDPDNDGEIEVYLSDGTQVEFTPNNEWKTIKCPGKGVPAALVPQAIANYVKSNFQSALITKIDKKYGSYEIELNNGAELHFAADGSFVGYDD